MGDGGGSDSGGGGTSQHRGWGLRGLFGDVGGLLGRRVVVSVRGFSFAGFWFCMYRGSRVLGGMESGVVDGENGGG